MPIVYENNDVTIITEEVDKVEMKVNVNGKNLIWISKSEEENFIQELSAVLDKYRI